MARGKPEESLKKRLEAGMALCEQQGLLELRIEDITARAGVAKGTFYLHFENRDAFYLALHSHFHEQIAQVIVAELALHGPGATRLLKCSQLYLDHCLRRSGVKYLLRQLRCIPALEQAVQLQNTRFSLLAQADFTALGFEQPGQVADLWIVMVAELAAQESVARQAHWGARAALQRFLTGSAV